MTVGKANPIEVEMRQSKKLQPWWQKRFFRVLLGNAVCENIDSAGMLVAVMMAGVTGIALGLVTMVGIIYLLYEILTHIWG